MAPAYRRNEPDSACPEFQRVRFEGPEEEDDISDRAAFRGRRCPGRLQGVGVRENPVFARCGTAV